MRETAVSQTALMTAFMRAAHQVLDGDIPLLLDPIAIQILGPQAKQRLEQASEMSKSPPARALRSYIVLRSRFAEDRLEAAIRRGVARYVLVGAGFDTFALRQPAWARGLAVIEVDHPATQRAKRERIVDGGLQIPSNVTFADIDFEKETLLEGLSRHGVPMGEPAFFSWLGVSMYLTEPTIDATLVGMTKFPVGSELVMTFAPPRASGSNDPTTLGGAAAKRLADIGEPFISFFEPAQIEKKLLHAGFSSVEFLTPELAKERYFRPGATLLPPPSLTTMLAAVR